VSYPRGTTGHLGRRGQAAWAAWAPRRRRGRDRAGGTCCRRDPIDSAKNRANNGLCLLLKEVIFYDFVLDRKHQDVIADYFVRGRHRNCSCIYISQSYYDIPKTIRLNASHCAFFKGYREYF